MSEAITYPKTHPAVSASTEAIRHGDTGWEVGRAECYAWAEVVDSLDPNLGSNVLQRLISWSAPRPGRKTGRYKIHIYGPAGPVMMSMNAPSTLEEARLSPLLQKVITRRDETLDAIRADHGDWTPRVIGVTEHLRGVLEATPEGSVYLSMTTAFREVICRKAATARAYTPDEWSRASSISTHEILREHPNRISIVARGITFREARLLRSEAQHEAKKDTPSGRSAALTVVRSHARRVSSEKPNTFRPVEIPKALRNELHKALLAGVLFSDIRRTWQRMAREEAETQKVA